MGSHRVGHDWSDLAAAAAANWINVGEQKNITTKWYIEEVTIGMMGDDR